MPYFVTISTNCDKVIWQGDIAFAPATICTSVHAKSIKIIASHQNTTIYKNIFLSSSRCQNINVGFNFAPLGNGVQYFSLFDRNYNLPIPSATLDFSRQGQ